MADEEDSSKHVASDSLASRLLTQGKFSPDPELVAFDDAVDATDVPGHV